MSEREGNGQKKGTIGRSVADWLDLPKDVVLDLPRIVLLGQNELGIENHRGIIECSENRMRINLARGFVEITGEELQIRMLCAEEIQLVGQIEQLSFRV